MIPTLQELYTSILSDLESELNINIPVFGRFVLRVFAAVQAAKLKTFYLAARIVQKNVFPDLADPESLGGTLERFGRGKLGRERFLPTQGIYTVSITGDNGAVVAAGTRFKSDDSALNPGNLFILDTSFTFPSTGTQTIQLRALVGGQTSRLQVGDTLTAISPLLNIDDQVTVTVEDTIPLEGETIEQYRDAILLAFRNESRGGAFTDYRLWSSDAQGVRLTFPYAKSGESNAVDVFVEANIADSADSKGTPTPAILTEVESVINFDPDTTIPLLDRGRRPVTVILDVLAVTPKDVEITINDSINITPDDKALIQSALFELILDIRPFIDGADILDNKNDILSINRIIFTIENTIGTGKSFGAVDVTVDAVPVVSSIQFTQGDIPFLDQVTYV